MRLTLAPRPGEDGPGAVEVHRQHEEPLDARPVATGDMDLPGTHVAAGAPLAAPVADALPQPAALGEDHGYQQQRGEPVAPLYGRRSLD
mgnify:CR=1 FL=1